MYTNRAMKRCAVALIVGLAAFGWAKLAAAQTEPDFCNISKCSNIIPGLTYSDSFETAMRELYAKVPLIGGNPDSLDLDFDGLKDTAQARLFDKILSFSLTTPNRNCVYWAYVGNRLKAEALALAINTGWPSWLGTAPDLENTKLFIAALTTMGNEEILNSVLSGIRIIIPSLPDLSILEFDGSAEVYLNSKGDADTDGVCNAGEYKAWVVTVPDDFDAFVSAAIDASVKDYFGGCDSCGAEGEGAVEGQAEGQTEVDMRSDESYYALMVLFGDTNDDGFMSKSELKSFATGWLLDLGWWLVDKDSDGLMSLSEFTASNRLGGLLPSNLDSDDDNKVTLSEIRQLSSKITQEQFDTADIDDNGYLDGIDLKGAGPQGSCYAEWCATQCDATAINSGFEAALRSLYGIASFLGVNADTADIDSNGIYDVAQARLLDYVLSHPDQNTFCCVRAAYMNNRVVAQTKWDSIPLISTIIPSSTFLPLVTGVLTQGEQSLIDSIVNVIDTLMFWGTFTLTGYDLSAGQYLASNGDPDYDAICNIGEYAANASNVDAFVAAALDPAQVTDGGGCPSCTEGEGTPEGSTEGTIEGTTEGTTEGTVEGSAEGSVEGQVDCVIDDATSYYQLMILFGDANGNGTLSKEEVKAVTGLSDLALYLWGLVDTNGDNEMTLTEFLGTEWLFNLLPGLDADSNNLLTLDEVHSLNGDITQGQFDAVDSNSNGVLDCADLVAGGEGEGEGVVEGSVEGTVEGSVEGTVEGTTEGTIEGSTEGTLEGTTEGAVEGSTEGQIDCTIDDTQSYYMLMLAFGDSNGNGTLSKSEVKAVTGLSDLALYLWGLVDTDGNGEMTQDEFMSTDWLFNLLPGLDDNSDNRLTLAEIRSLNSAITQTQFDAVDLNMNGAIDCYDLYGGGEGEPEGTVEGQPEGTVEGEPEGAVEGQPEGTVEGEPEGAVEGEPEGTVEGQPEGTVEGEPEGAVEGQPEGTVEGQPEGSTEGEECTLNPCPSFDAEGTEFCTKLSQELSVSFDWATCDLDQSGIPDNFEIALLEAVVCNHLGGFGQDPICLFNANVAMMQTEASYPVFANFDNVVCGMMTISSEGLATMSNFHFLGTYSTYTLEGGAEPLAADGDPDQDGLTNLVEYQNTLLAGLGRADYVIAALTPNSTEEGEGTAEGSAEGTAEGVTEGSAEGSVEGTTEGTEEGTAEGAAEGSAEGSVEGTAEGSVEGTTEGTEEGTAEGVTEGSAEGSAEGTVEGTVEGSVEGTEDGEGGEVDLVHTADQDGNYVISLTELLRVIQFFNLRGYQCGESTEDGYTPGLGFNLSCDPHDSDYSPQDWQISLTELLRLIQFFNLRGYYPCADRDTEDGFCPGLPPV